MKFSRIKSFRAGLVLVFICFCAFVFLTAACEKAPPTPPAAPTPTPEPEPTPPSGIPLEGVIRSGETLPAALAQFKVEQERIEPIIAALKVIDFPFRKIRPNQTFTTWIEDPGIIRGFDYHVDKLHTYQVRENPAGELVAELIEIPTTVKVRRMGGRVLTSVYTAILEAGESDALASLVSNVFAWDVDFYTDPRVGDSFRLIYEKRFVQGGEPHGYRHLLAAEYDGEVTGVKRGYWFAVGDEDWDGFYDEDGKQLRKTFLVAPLDTMRVTSRYGMRRHPILGRRKMHHGVDYGAPRGTPVWAVAAGKVISSGRAGAAGNMVKLSHPGGFVTMYLHLSRLNVRVGQQVRQRQMIGRVGSTGRSTGPHLDFRVKQNGQYINPQRLRMIASPLKVLPPQHRTAFATVIAAMKPQLEAVSVPDQTPTPPPSPATE